MSQQTNGLRDGFLLSSATFSRHRRPTGYATHVFFSVLSTQHSALSIQHSTISLIPTAAVAF